MTPPPFIFHSPKQLLIVKVKVKPKHREEYLKLCDEEPKFDGMISAKYVEIAPNTFTFIGEWKTQEDIIESRPRMISFLDKLRHMLEEISPESGVTEPASGSVIIEK